MKVSYNWLKELVDLNGIDREKFVHDLSLHVVEVDGVENLEKATNLVVGEVLEKVKHPDADKLNVCQVNVGTDVRQIVCGAPNCQAGKKVIVALPGARLPGGEIKEAKVRGVESRGMLCSLQELGVESKYVPAEYQHGIYFLSDDAKVGQNAIKALQYDDLSIELGLTPNRMDLLSMLGVARDVSTMYKRPLLPLQYNLVEEDKHVSEELELELETRACYSYYARIIKDVEIKESPEFIKTRLMAAGIRPINNVVDISNYILVLFGQPLHAFDQDKLGDKIIVRRAKNGEKLVTLDEQERTLESRDIVICDNKEKGGRIVCLGGVMGGLDTEVTPETKNIVLESAVFRGATIRRTSKRLNLRSESSVRYERGVDLNSSLLASNYACYLMQKYANGKVLKGYIHEGESKVEDKEIVISTKLVNDYLGLSLEEDEIVEILNSLGFTVKVVKDNLKVYVPNRRMDITIPADLVEEVARINGYEHLNETLPAMSTTGALTKEQRVRRLVKNFLTETGCNETITYSLTHQNSNKLFNILTPAGAHEILISNPLTEDRATPRMNLTNSLLEALKYNTARKVKDIKFYEVGKVYYQVGKEYIEEMRVAGSFTGVYSKNIYTGVTETVDFYLVKGLLEELFVKLNAKVDYRLIQTPCDELHPTRTAEILLNNEVIGFVGELHPRFATKNGLENTYVFEVSLDKILKAESSKFVFKPISKIPPVERDLALVMDIDQPVSEVLKAIYSTDKQAITNVYVFDEYIGDKLEAGKKSIAVRITIESEKTLTEEEISSKMKKVMKSLEYRYNITLRA